MDDSLSFVGSQGPGARLSEGSGAFRLSHSRSAQSNSLEGQPSCGMTGDGLAWGLGTVSIFLS